MTDANRHSRHDRLVARVLERLDAEALTPRPRWAFLLSNWFFWALGILAVALGAVAFSAGLFEVENAEWALYPATHPDFVSFFIESAPFLWILALALFMLIGYINIRRTRRGYRYPLYVIAIGAVLTSVTLGSALYGAGLGARIETTLGDHPPFYRPILVRERAWWIAPAQGLLAGTVESSAPDLSEFILQDFSGQEWTIDGSDLSEADRTVVARGGIVRVIGLPASATATSSSLHACFVFPWEVRGGASGSAPRPRPVAAIASTSATNGAAARSEICKGLGPYERLRTVDDNGLF